MNFRKLQVLEKHERIGELVNELAQNKNSFIECTRIANEIRLQKMHSMNSPQKNKGSP